MSRAGAVLLSVVSWLLVGGLFLVPLTLGRLDEQRDLWAHIILCIVGGLAVVGMVLVGGIDLRWRPLDWALVFLVAIYLLAALRTVFPRGTLAELMRLADYLALYWLVQVLLRKRELFIAGAAAFGAGSALCAALGLQEYLVTALLGDRSWRAFGPFYNPNLLAAALLMAIPVWIALTMVARSWALRLLCGLILLVCWAGFFVTGSKGGLIALAGALLTGAVIAPDPARPGAWRRAAAVACLTIMIALTAGLLPPIRMRIAAAFGPQSNSMMFRYYTWLGTWQMALNRPLLGFGPGTFAAAYPRFAIVGHTLLAHETYLQVAAETGILGALALLSVLFTQLASAVGAARRLAGEYRTISVAAATGMVGFCLHNVVDYAWHVTATGMAFWILAGLVAAAWWHGNSAPAQSEHGERHPSIRARSERGPVGRAILARAALAGLIAFLVAMPAGLAIRADRLARAGDLRSASRVDPLNDKYPRQLALQTEDAAGPERPGLYDEAVAYWQRVKKLRPTYPGTHYHLARIYAAQGRPVEALREYERAVTLAPTWTKALVAQAKLLRDLGQDTEALEVYRRLDALSRSPLFTYRAVVDDLDPNFVYAWIALADVEPTDQARERYVKSTRYLRRVFAANRRMEGAWRLAGEWERKQSPELVWLAEEVARRNLSFSEPGPRLRAALLLVDAGLVSLAKELFVESGNAITGEEFFGEIVRGWRNYVTSQHLQAVGNYQAANRLLEAAARRIRAALAHKSRVDSLQRGPYGWSHEEIAQLEMVIEQAVRRTASVVE